MRICIIFFSPAWEDGLRDAEDHLILLGNKDLSSKVKDPFDPELMQMARLDCDWNGECLRAFAAIQNKELELFPALIADTEGLLEFIKAGSFGDAVPWLILINRSPALAESVIGNLLEMFRRQGVRFSTGHLTRPTGSFRALPKPSLLMFRFCFMTNFHWPRRWSRPCP